tara:strand:- start:389 stop:880 length:492 start_codon:yes stop_codon:yes gene_type:complete
MKISRLITLLALLSLCACRSGQPQDDESVTFLEADVVIRNAKIFTSSAEQSWAEALAISNGQFVYVGDNEGAEAIQASLSADLQGRLVLPGLIDGHAHPGYVSVENFGEVSGETKEALLASVKAYADQHPEQRWLRLCCWPTAMFVDGTEGPQKEVLDAVLPD